MTFFNCLALEPIKKESILRRRLRNSPPVRPSGGPQHLRHPANKRKSPETDFIISPLTRTCGHDTHPEIFVKLIRVARGLFSKTQGGEREFDF